MKINLNTSYVKVQLTTDNQLKEQKSNLNTSYVKVQRFRKYKKFKIL